MEITDAQRRRVLVWANSQVTAKDVALHGYNVAIGHILMAKIIRSKMLKVLRPVS